jgi:hypothetical protein
MQAQIAGRASSLCFWISAKLGLSLRENGKIWEIKQLPIYSWLLTFPSIQYLSRAYYMSENTVKTNSKLSKLEHLTYIKDTAVIT